MLLWWVGGTLSSSPSVLQILTFFIAVTQKKSKLTWKPWEGMKCFERMMPWMGALLNAGVQRWAVGREVVQPKGQNLELLICFIRAVYRKVWTVLWNSQRCWQPAGVCPSCRQTHSCWDRHPGAQHPAVSSGPLQKAALGFWGTARAQWERPPGKEVGLPLEPWGHERMKGLIPLSALCVWFASQGEMFSDEPLWGGTWVLACLKNLLVRVWAVVVVRHWPKASHSWKSFTSFPLL